MSHKFSPTRLGVVIVSVLITTVLLVGQLAWSGNFAGAQGDDRATGRPTETKMQRAGVFQGDLRNLPAGKPAFRQPREHADPLAKDKFGSLALGEAAPIGSGTSSAPEVAAPAPITGFNGLSWIPWGSGHPPDTVGDVGPNHYIQSVNASVGIYNKTTGAEIAAFTLDTFMAQGNFGNLCDTDNFGDPVVLYDTFEDRWIITDFAFKLDGSKNVVNPPGAYQCFAASRSGDPVAGGWNFYSLHMTDYLNDYPKLGIWPDGLYMSANMFGFPAGSPFAVARVWALNKAQMYAGNSTIQVVSFDAPAGEFSLLPSNARLQAGTPPAGSPNYFSMVWNWANVVSVYKFHVDWNSISTSTFTGPFDSQTSTLFAVPPTRVPSGPGGSNLDTLNHRLMMQNQYSNIGGVESLWNAHTVRGSSSAQAAVRYYQVNVTGGTVQSPAAQAATYNPDASNRFQPSIAVDRAGNMAMGYSVSSSTLFPAIRYAGRLATDPVNTIGQTETSLVEGGGTQVGSNRWGDYAAMTLDPDGCTFWLTHEYYAASGLNWQTRIGSFRYTECTPAGNGTLQGTVTATGSGDPIAGATVALGSRTATTNGSGFYQFTNLPAGTYPGISASYPGYIPGAANSIAVPDGGTATQNFSLGSAAITACLADTSQADFQTGVPSSVDLTGSPGDVTLLKPVSIDQQNTNTGAGFGVAFNTTAWAGQTFTPAVTGQMVGADLFIFCNGCATTPDLTVSLRATSGGLPTGPDVASSTITYLGSGYLRFGFSSPPTLTAGTTYALAVRPVTNPSAGGYALVRSGTQFAGADVYAGGAHIGSTDGGATWSPTIRGGVGVDAGFKVYMQTGFPASANLVSGLKDANPAAGRVVSWDTLSWTATTPANTAVEFQAAGSANAAGPFNFVGPDGTAATFFTTSGASLSQFDGLRYLKYKAILRTTDGAITPTLADVAVCHVNRAIALSDSSVDEGQPINTVVGTLSNLDPSTGDTHTYSLVSGAGDSDNGSFNISGSQLRTSQVFNRTTKSSYSIRVQTDDGAGGTLADQFTITVDPVAQAVSFIDALGVTVAGNNISRAATGPSAWGYGATSNLAIETGTGYVEASIGSLTDMAAFGLGNGNDDQTVNDIDFAIYFAPNRSSVEIAEKGRKVCCASAIPYTTADVFRVAIELDGSTPVVRYYKGASLLHTNASPTLNYPLLLDSALYNPGSALKGAMIFGGDLVAVKASTSTGPPGTCQNVTWTNVLPANQLSVVNGPGSAASIQRTAGTGWNAGASSVQSFASGGVPGAAEATIGSAGGYVVFGLSKGDDNQSNSDVDYAFYAYPPTKLLQVLYRGAVVKSVGDFSLDDVLRVEFSGGTTVRFYRNNVPLLVAKMPAGSDNFPALIDTSLYNTGARLDGVKLCSSSGGTRPVDANVPQVELEEPKPQLVNVSFGDVQSGDFYYDAVQYLGSRGIVSGYADGTFRPYANTTRAQLAKMVVSAVGLQLENPAEPTFSDVSPSNPFYQFVETAVALRMVNGYADGTFRPYTEVTRGQLAKMVVLGMTIPLEVGEDAHFSDVPASNPFYEYVETAYNRGLITGYADGSFRPGANATRGQIAKIVHLSVQGAGFTR